jgi:hypothetical protein
MLLTQQDEELLKTAHAIAEKPVKHIVLELESPQWNRAIGEWDWRYHAPSLIRELWPTLGMEARISLYITYNMAAEAPLSSLRNIKVSA